MALLVLVCAVGCGDDPRSDGPVIGGWEPPPCVVVRSPGVDFGTFELDDEGNLLDGPAEAEVAIGNECEGSLEIRQIVLDESMATIDEPCAHGLLMYGLDAVILAQGDVATLQLRYEPTEPGPSTTSSHSGPTTPRTCVLPS